MDISQKITEELGVKRWQVDAAVKLIDEGNTIPFIARYRKEATGTLDDAQLRTLHERLQYLRGLEENKEQVLSTIEEQGKLTEELKKQILCADHGGGGGSVPPLPAKEKDQAIIAKEKGLSPWRLIICRAQRSLWRGRRKSMWIRKRRWLPRRRPSPGPGTSSQKIFLTTRTTEAISGS